MQGMQPTFEVSETVRNSHAFVKENKAILWDIVKSVAPYLVVLHFIDSIVTAMYYPPDSESSFGIGALIASYFYTVILINWHRVVIWGPDKFIKMNPLRPKGHELSFLGMGIVIGLIPILIIFLGITLPLTFLKGDGILGLSLAVSSIFIAVIFSYYFTSKLSFYFPAKATMDHVTFKDSFKLTKGYVWKMTLCLFLCYLKIMLLLIPYIVLSGVVGYFSTFYLNSMTAEIIIFILTLPSILYFTPMFYVYVATTLSNYYMHAMQTRGDEIATA